MLREALLFLKLNHPAYRDIEVKEDNFTIIEKDIDLVKRNNTKAKNNQDTPALSACQSVRDSGQNQVIEEHIAQEALTSPLTVEARASKEEVSETIKQLFKSISQKGSPKYSSQSILEGWPLMFPCLLWNGKGGPNSCVYNKISLREWVNYVIQVPSLDFRKHIIFISFANIILRRKRITGLTAHKPISSSVEEAVKELVRISQSSCPTDVPEATLNTLAKKVGAYVDELPGSLSDMRKFRNDILSMRRKHGPPTYFVTLSSADSMWPEGFVAATNGKITIKQAKPLSAVERANLIAQNPVAFTEVWKRKVRAFLDFIIKGESKPLGEITHYVQKAEWQGRLSEHAHFLFWTKESLPALNLYDNGDLKGQQDHICFKAEAVGSAMIHIYPKIDLEEDEYTITQEEKDLNHELKALSKENIFNSITQEPISFEGYFLNGRARKCINDLVRSINLHICSAYCTNNGKSNCKSSFPFQVRNETVVKKVVDKNRNTSYRILLRRNHSRVNQYSTPIVNFWRANMDLTILCGNPFSSIIYVTYYTSKLDKSSNIRDFLQKIKALDDNTETKGALRKLLINMDTCRATGLPEASSNLLLFPHRYTSSKILRLDTRYYLQTNETNEEELIENSETLNSILHKLTKHNEEFALPEPKLHNNRLKRFLMDTITQNYLNRPLTVYDIKQNRMIDSTELSMTKYTENYKITQKRKIGSTKQSRDRRNRIIEPREFDEQDVILDLKFHISPPNCKDHKWCAGALALHVPHVSLKDLLTINDKQRNVVEAYDHYYSEETIDNITGEPIPLYPLLHTFENNETDLYTATSSIKHLPLQLVNKKAQNVPDDLDKLYTESEGMNELSQEEDLDPDNYSTVDKIAYTNIKKETCKSWNGTPHDQFLFAENPWNINNIKSDASKTIDSLEISEQHRSFMSLILAGNNPDTSCKNSETEQALSFANGNREIAASQFLKRTMTECKNNEQRNAIKTVTSVLEAYYYGKYKTSANITKQSVKNTPIITMIGVPGAGKSWIISKIRSWIDIRFKTTDLLCNSSEYKTLNQTDLPDPVTGKIQESITHLPEGKFGKSAAIRF